MNNQTRLTVTYIRNNQSFGRLIVFADKSIIQIDLQRDLLRKVSFHHKVGRYQLVNNIY